MNRQELSKKATILFQPALYRHLALLARRRGASVGELVRDACEAAYGRTSGEERRLAVDDLAGLNLPVDDVATMKRQSTPSPKKFLS